MTDWGTDELTETGIEAEPVDLEDMPQQNTTSAEDEPTLYYGSTDEFYREYFRFMYRRRINGKSRKWAARWWEYDEAIARLEAIWRAWEFLRKDAGTGSSVWWLNHADTHMAVLMDPDGPFADVEDKEENQNRKGEPLPYIAPSAGLFPDVRNL